MQFQVKKLSKIDNQAKEDAYLDFCLSMSEVERIAYLEKLNQNLWEIWLANPENQALLDKTENDKPKRLQRLSKSTRKI
ncbi:MAG: hypothetical protein MUE85_13595 [Microscillaceae bacterium]|jgi:hypothetical protein|nr:hypothetical protein [Microscillaceae bacterium]